MEDRWVCPLCGHLVDEPDRTNRRILKDYHERTRHGAQNVRPSSGSSKSSGSSGVVGDLVEDFVEGVGNVIGGIFKIFD